MNYVNLTPHTINVVGRDSLTIPPSGNSLRVAQEMIPVHPSEVGGDQGIDFYRAKYGEVELINNATKDVVPGGLPPVFSHDLLYIVSGQCLEALKGVRFDFAAPGELVRDAEGKPIGCKGLRLN